MFLFFRNNANLVLLFTAFTTLSKVLDGISPSFSVTIIMHAGNFIIGVYFDDKCVRS